MLHMLYIYLLHKIIYDCPNFIALSAKRQPRFAFFRSLLSGLLLLSFAEFCSSRGSLYGEKKSQINTEKSTFEIGFEIFFCIWRGEGGK